ncbi:MAG: hypothetical protein MK193_04810 [Lentisphaeria bacterium]|nr:hypothetical protein [Lentisphaeria bacterium]
MKKTKIIAAVFCVLAFTMTSCKSTEEPTEATDGWETSGIHTYNTLYGN